MNPKSSIDDAMAAIEIELNKINQRLDRQYDETQQIRRRLDSLEKQCAESNRNK